MSWWKRKAPECGGFVPFRGLPPRPENFEGLRKAGIEISSDKDSDDTHWVLSLRYSCLEDRIEATLASVPFHIARMTPFGLITPRSMTAARQLRAHRDEPGPGKV